MGHTQWQIGVFGVPDYQPRRAGKYRPRIIPRHLRRLWLEKQRTGKPMTKLVEKALDEYFRKQP
jgi:hypothetical protein